jgi:uncharacterized DUF497 family protein
MGFEWDDAKDRSNQKKHGLSFSEAARLFQSSQDYLEIFDAAHSQAEDRFIAIGEIDRGIVVVVYTEREDDLIRIIGARFATKREQERYREHKDRYI